MPHSIKGGSSHILVLDIVLGYCVDPEYINTISGNRVDKLYRARRGVIRCIMEACDDARCEYDKNRSIH